MRIEDKILIEARKSPKQFSSSRFSMLLDLWETRRK